MGLSSGVIASTYRSKIHGMASRRDMDDAAQTALQLLGCSVGLSRPRKACQECGTPRIPYPNPHQVPKVSSLWYADECIQGKSAK